MRRLLLVLLLTACATLGEGGAGDRDLPTSGAGPFRKLAGEEVPGVAPYVLALRASRLREPEAVSLLGGPAGSVQLFAVARADDGHDAIVRTVALDGRAFYGAAEDSGHTPEVVLRATLPWEHDDLGGPSVLFEAGATTLYYAANGSIGRARSPDGRQFTKDPDPVLVGERAYHAPSAFRREDGALGLLVTVDCQIFEARSPDGTRFELVDSDPATPALDPVLSAAGPAAVLAPNEPPPFDEDCVSDAFAFPRVTEGGRLQLRVLYTGKRRTDSAIGFAARFGDAGPLRRNTTPVLRSTLHERAPTAWEHEGETFLYFEMDKSFDKEVPFPSIGAAIAPATTPPLPRSATFPNQL